MSDLHRPFGNFSANGHDRDLSQEARTDATRDDADALDAWLNEMVRNDGFPNTRRGNGHDRPPVRTDDHDGRNDAGSLTATAASFHRRIEAVQSRDLRASSPDPRLWETIMDRTSTPVPATAAATMAPANAWRATKPSQDQPGSVPRRAGSPQAGRARRQQVWNMVANVGLIIAIVLAGFGVWRLSGEPGLPGGAGDQPTVPGFAMLSSMLDATPGATEAPAVSAPPVATPQPTTDCDFSSDIPIFTGVESPPTEGTALMLSPDGDVVLSCPEEPADTTLATGVATVWPGEWPGIVGVDYDADKPQDRQPAFINLLTGDIVDIGVDPEAMQVLHRQPSDSPWLISADHEDPTRWRMTDLRTMESRLVSELGEGEFSAGARIITTANGADGTALFAAQAPFTERGGGEIINGQVLVIEGSLDSSRWLTLPADLQPVTDMALSPDGQHFAATSNPSESDGSGTSPSGRMYAYGILRVADGQEVARSQTFGEEYETTMQWAQDGDAFVYTQDMSLMLLEAEPNAEPVALIEGDQPLRIDGITADPGIVLVSRQPKVDSSGVIPSGEEIHLYAVDTTTGEMITMQGRDVSQHVYPWEPASRFVVMYQPQVDTPEAVTYDVLDATTGEQISELAAVPLNDRGGSGVAYPDLGRYSVASTMDGTIEVMASDTRHIYLMRMVDGMPEVRQIASPPGLPSEVSMTASVFLSPDGSMLSLAGEEDESRTRWLLHLDGGPDEWIEVPTTEPGEGPDYILFVPGTGN